MMMSLYAVVITMMVVLLAVWLVASAIRMLFRW